MLHATTVSVCVCITALPNLQFRNQIEILRLLSKCTSTYIYVLSHYYGWKRRRRSSGGGKAQPLTSQAIARRSRRGSGGLRQLLPVTLSWCAGHHNVRCTHCLFCREPSLSLGDGSVAKSGAINWDFPEVSGKRVRSRVCIASLQVATAALCLLSAGTSCLRDSAIPLSHV